MAVSTTLLNLVKRFEGCRLTAYQDIVGVWTIGYGCTGPEVVEGLVWTQEQADADLEQKLEAILLRLQQLVTVALSDNQRDALADFCYNLGCQALASSFLLQCVNASNFEAASAQFLRWNHAGGKVVAGLTERRQAEATLFSS